MIISICKWVVGICVTLEYYIPPRTSTCPKFVRVAGSAFAHIRKIG